MNLFKKIFRKKSNIVDELSKQITELQETAAPQYNNAVVSNENSPNSFVDNLDAMAKQEINKQDALDDFLGPPKKLLEDKENEKTFLRTAFFWFFVVLLFFQFVSVVVFIILDATEAIPFKINSTILTVYITSVFVETLGAIILMIQYAFRSEDEIKIVQAFIELAKNILQK